MQSIEVMELCQGDEVVLDLEKKKQKVKDKKKGGTIEKKRLPYPSCMWQESWFLKYI